MTAVAGISAPTLPAAAQRSPFHDTAIALQQAGWFPFPLPYGAKSPPPADRTGASGLWPTAADLDAELRTTAAPANVGIRLPPGVLGVDVDAYVKGGTLKPGAATLAALEAELGPLPATWRLTSRDDGVSGIPFYGVLPDSSWPGVIGPGIEALCWHYRYAVAANSVHPDTGRAYRWVDPDGNPSATAPLVDDLPDLPIEWHDRFRAGPAADAGRVDRHHLAGGVDVAAFRDATAGDPCPATRGPGVDLLAAVAGGGSRHDATLSALWRVAALSVEGHRGGAEAFDQIGQAFTRAVADDSRRPADREWQAMVLGAVTSAASRVWELWDPCTSTFDLTGRTDAERAADLAERLSAAAAATSAAEVSPAEARARQVDAEAERIRIREEAQQRVRAERAATVADPDVTGLGAFLKVPDEPLAFRVEGLLPVGGHALFSAPYKAGKTTARDNLVRALADGGDFLGAFLVHRPEGLIFLFDDEMDARQLRRWLRAEGIVKVDRVVVVALRGKVGTFDLLDPDCRARWAARLREAGAAFVILDCLRPVLDALGLSEDKEAGRFLVAFDALLDEAGVSEAVVVHHAGHSGERARGDSRLRDWPDAEWLLIREQSEAGDSQPDARRFFTAYGRDVDVPEGLLEYDPATRRLTFTGGNRRETVADDLLPAVLAFLRANPGSSGRGVEQALCDDGGHPRMQVRQALRRGVDRILIQTGTGPHRSLQHYVVGAETGPRA